MVIGRTYGLRLQSNYIDSVIFRDRDVVTSGGGAASTSDGGSNPREERTYITQNWRADVVANVTRSGNVIEWIQYTPYGMAMTHPAISGDFNADGGVDGSDYEAFFEAWSDGNPGADVNGDGGVDNEDTVAFLAAHGAGLQSGSGLNINTNVPFGYAGYVWDGAAVANVSYNWSGAAGGLYHVRNRVYDPELGRWTRRDPIGYVDGMNVYEYVKSSPVLLSDAFGRRSAVGGSGASSRIQIKLPGTATTLLQECAQLLPDTFGPVLGQFAQTGCTIPTITISPSCGEDEEAAYSCGSKSIEVCPTSLSGGGRAKFDKTAQCRALAHEMIHSLDHCNGLTDCTFDGCQTGYCVTDCEARACSEIRAYAASGQCCGGPNGALVPGCVELRAADSTEAGGCDRSAVAKMMKSCLPSNSCSNSIDLTPPFIGLP